MKKCGRTSRATSGTIRSVNATARVSGYPTGTRVFTNQIQTTFMLRPGDSGSVLINSSNNKVVGLGFAGSSSRSFHNHIRKIRLATLNQGKAALVGGGHEELTKFDIDGFLTED